MKEYSQIPTTIPAFNITFNFYAAQNQTQISIVNNQMVMKKKC